MIEFSTKLEIENNQNYSGFKQTLSLRCQFHLDWKHCEGSEGDDSRFTETTQHSQASRAVDSIFQTQQYDNKKVVSQTCKLSNIYVGKARIMSVSTHFARDA